MTVTTMTFPNATSLDAPVARLAAAAVRALRSVATWFHQAGVRSEPKTAEELLEWAAQYEATQPSYAADLRAAACQYQASH